MDPNIAVRLKAIEEAVQKNHDLLIRIRRVQRNAQLFRLFYWVLILLATFGAFYYIQPYLNQLIDTYTGIQNAQQQLQYSLPEMDSLNGILNQLKGM